MRMDLILTGLSIISINTQVPNTPIWDICTLISEEHPRLGPSNDWRIDSAAAALGIISDFEHPTN